MSDLLRRIAAAVCAFFLLPLSARAAAEPAYVELILDASNSMWAKLEDGRPRITAAKQVLADFIAQTPADPNLNVGLRIYGSQVRVGQPGACDDSKLFVPLRGFDRAALLQAVRDARAIGSTPIAKSLQLAAADLAPLPAGARVTVLLVTDGEETCGGDVSASVGQLKAAGAKVELRIIGIGLSRAAVERFSKLAPIENANSGAALAAAIGRAMQPVLPAPPPAAPKLLPVRVTFTRDGKPATVPGATVSLDASGKASALTGSPDGAAFTGQFAPGGYTPSVRLAGEAQPRTFPIVSVVVGDRNEFVLKLVDPEKILLRASPPAVITGQKIKVVFGPARLGEPKEGSPEPVAANRLPTVARILLAPVGSADETELASADCGGPSGTVEIVAPDFSGDVEARYAGNSDAGPRVAGRSNSVRVSPPPITIKAPPRVEAGAIVSVEWAGPAFEDDVINFAPASAVETGAYVEGSWARVTAGSPSKIRAPQIAGEYEVRYYLSASERVGARARVTVTAAVSSLDAPAEAMAGDAVEVKFTPKESAAALCIVPSSAESSEYGDSWGRNNEEGRVTLTAPLAPGAAELRYLAEGGIVIAKRPIRIVPPRGTLDAPAQVKAGGSIAVKWSGPRGRGAWITITKPDAPEAEYTSYQNTAEITGPAELNVPGEPGAYEIRFVIWDAKVIARRPLRVTP